ncbi:hypothetical protein ILYODFUR_021159 [Ilyodon furcidens]|uniref:Uncharacterized protein n=1 Tax=Ilyodon furcidens TaxID=33524 RepID=A0ABV0TMC7_9TELE
MLSFGIFYLNWDELCKMYSLLLHQDRVSDDDHLDLNIHNIKAEITSHTSQSCRCHSGQRTTLKQDERSRCYLCSLLIAPKNHQHAHRLSVIKDFPDSAFLFHVHLQHQNGLH